MQDLRQSCADVNYTERISGVGVNCRKKKTRVELRVLPSRLREKNLK